MVLCEGRKKEIGRKQETERLKVKKQKTKKKNYTQARKENPNQH